MTKHILAAVLITTMFDAWQAVYAQVPSNTPVTSNERAALESQAVKLAEVVSREGVNAAQSALGGANAIVVVNDGALDNIGSERTFLKISFLTAGGSRELIMPPRTMAVVFVADAQLTITSRFCPAGGLFLNDLESPSGWQCNGPKWLLYESQLDVSMSGRRVVLYSSKRGKYNWLKNGTEVSLEKQERWRSGWGDISSRRPSVLSLDGIDPSKVYSKSVKQIGLERDLVALRVAREMSSWRLRDSLIQIDNALSDISAEESERIRREKEGDGSPDDLICKSRRFLPATSPYQVCRISLALERQSKERREREQAEKLERDRVERERLAALERVRKAQRERELAEKQERERAERARVAALEHERKAQRERELADRRERERVAREETLLAARAADPYYDEKAQCRGLGFKPNTEKFGTCVLELSRREPSTEAPVVQSGDGTPDDSTCRGYGFSVGTSGYSTCRMTLDNARRSYERELQAYEAARAEYERRAAEAAAEAERERSQRQAQYGFCVASCSSQPGATFLGCASRCGSQSAGVAYDPGPAPRQPSGVTTYVINGRIVRCNTFGSFVTCN